MHYIENLCWLLLLFTVRSKQLICSLFYITMMNFIFVFIYDKSSWNSNFVPHMHFKIISSVELVGLKNIPFSCTFDVTFPYWRGTKAFI